MNGFSLKFLKSLVVRNFWDTRLIGGSSVMPIILLSRLKAFYLNESTGTSSN